ncbi:hypothetical protein [Rhabdochlamydiaceae symbiont of Dictyostelium giganteum]|uniref:hypothetical protein n=1 Tax=Rhabdochlamydiaceae symbiont of Dictyostelium giganteum TaxID=3342349 RepID=UPI003850B128
MQQKNVDISLASSFFNGKLPFDLVFDQSVDEMLDQILSKNDLYFYKRILILDDGGHLIEKINARFPHDLPIVGIEQTSSGVNKTQGKD